MQLYRNISFLIAILLSMMSSVAIASDDNPWRMESPGDEQQPYYDLNGSTTGGYIGNGQRLGDATPPRPVPGGDRANESTIPKSLPDGERMGWKSAPGKGPRDEIYGYAGPQLERPLRARRSPEMIGKGIRYGGKNYGAFAPIEPRPGLQQSPPLQGRQGDVKNIQGQGARQGGATAFANVPPPPIPDAAPAVPILPYPYVGYGNLPGYGLPYGTRIAPYAGSGVQGPTLSNPGIPPGAFGPGFMW